MKKSIILLMCFFLVNLYSFMVFADMDIIDLPWHLKVNNVESCWNNGWFGDKVYIEVWDSKVNFASILLNNKKWFCQN